ncbi:M48 family metalloprotease [Solitalea canadensis]|uniref:Zn-dependent protease with chaperone function n=1 Tax=Solitalea canadensis (strain ATCC 29591 / DSM 3403 / JCM 21819 / LMG 8368 / NBRC 15130 / NCIMB 12057 / USAM 9D) TaxID=929556 RepID=H8KVC7_SOLCM|nr:M48 family metalloprotease [Solitalea canadensis]AFD06307.1 Zn-dependent protease with chaperone function [Solitalea canadensis DSM 3403]
MLTALSYHLKVRDYFKQQSKTWTFFREAKNKEEQLKEFKTQLLKSSYKYNAETDSLIYDKVNFAKQQLGLDHLPVTVYQAEFSDERNASIIYVDNEAHIVFSGAITKLLNDEELLAIIAHELTHVKLFQLFDGELEIANRIINAIANNYNSDPAYFETARLFKLYTEIFCDRGSYTVVQNRAPIITALVKIATGVESVNADSFLKQADEIFQLNDLTKADTFSHPENFIRAKALQLWHEQKEGAEVAISRIIEGQTDLDKLDIFKQVELANFTRKFLQLFLKPKWFQSSTIIALARQYFADFSLDENAVLNESILAITDTKNISIKEYLSYVLFDFSSADGSLEEIPRGWAFQFSEDLQLRDEFESIVKKELKMSDKKMQLYKLEVLKAYYEVKENEGEQIYSE